MTTAVNRPALNRHIALASRPRGFPSVSDFRLVYSAIPSLLAGEVLVRVIYLSLEPCMRTRMSEVGRIGPLVDIGELMPGDAVGLVVDSQDLGFRVGDAVLGMLGWQEYAVSQGNELRKLDPRLAPISTALGVLGQPGLTAYFGLLDICDPHPGETVVVSGAAGGVGMIAGQIARIRGCRVVGVGGAVKVSWLLDELGFDAALSETSSTDPGAPLEQHATLEGVCPDGIDVYFDTVGGSLSDAVFPLINTGARIAVASQASQDNLECPELGPRWLGQVMAREAKVQGFLVSGYLERFPEGLDQLAHWLEQGKLKYREDVALGLESAPQAFIAMLRGANEGKQLVQLAEM